MQVYTSLINKGKRAHDMRTDSPHTQKNGTVTGILGGT